MVTQPEETLKEFMQRWAKAAALALKRQADLLGIPQSTLANALNPDIADMHYHLRWLLPHMAVVGDLGPLDYLEACCGRVAFPIPSSPDCVADLQCELSRCIQDFSELMQASGDALEDGRILRNEVKRIERTGLELVRQVMGFLESAKAKMEKY